MRYVFFINPVAGKGKGPEMLVPAIDEYFKGRDEDYSIIITEAAGDAKNKARAEAEKGDEVTIFACGGDGTFFEVLNGAAEYPNVTFGVIPCGSGNDFLKFFGETTPFTSIKNQIEGSAFSMDAVKVDDTYCMNVCSMGMDAVVADGMSKFKNIPFVSGSMAYKLSIVKTFFGKLGQKAKIWVDGKLLGTYDCLFAVCANGPVYGGGYRCAPAADPMDGKLEWLIVEKISKLSILRFLKKYENGTHEDLPCCHKGQCSVMEIEAEKDEPINLDGEIVRKRKIRFELKPAAVRFMLPRGICEKYSDRLVVAKA